MAGIIIVEGPDHVGKTTFCRYMQQALNARYIKLTYRWPDRMFTYHLAAIRRAIRLAQQGRFVILDRWWLSEVLYGQVYRNGGLWPELHMLARVGLTHSAINVLILPETEEQYLRLRKLHKKAELYDHSEADLYRAYAAFRDTVLHRNDWVLADKDYAWAFPSHVIEDVVDSSTSMRGAQWKFVRHTDNFLGHRQFSRHVLVGDRRNPKKYGPAWPFIDYGDSSLFITRAIKKVSQHDYQFGWTNAYLEDGHLAPEPRLLVQEADWPVRLIALGNNAAKALRDQGLAHAKIHHPQFYRRFHHCDGALERDLEKAIA